MTREKFITIANNMREFSQWELQLYDLGIDLTDSPAVLLFDTLLAILDGNNDFTYNKETGLNELIEWCDSDVEGYGKDFDAGALYDYLCELNGVPNGS